MRRPLPVSVLLTAALLHLTAGDSGVRFAKSSPGVLSLASFNGTGVAFTACDAVYGCELFFYNLQDAPYLVADIEPGAGHSMPQELTPNGSVLYFVAFNSGTGTEVYRWNALNASAPVLPIKDAVPGPGSSYPSQLAILDSTLFFGCTVSAFVGTELCKYNAGTDDLSVVDIVPGSGSSSPQSLSAFNGLLYLQASTPATGAELFAYDPGAATVTLVADIYPGATGSFPLWMTPFQGKLYFQAIGNASGGELWSFSASRVPTVQLVADIDPSMNHETPPKPSSTYPAAFTPVGSMLYFYAQTDANGSELYVMNGTNEAVAMVTDMMPGPVGSSPSSLLAFHEALYYAAADPAYGRELRVVNGTLAAPELVADLEPGPVGSNPSFLALAGGYMLFSAYNSTAGSGLWMYADPGPLGVPLPSATVTATPTASVSATQSSSATQTPPNTPSQSGTSSESGTASATVTASVSGTGSAAQTATGSHTAAETVSMTHTSSDTPTSTRSGTPSSTVAPSFSASSTQTGSGSQSNTQTPSPSRSSTASGTAAPSGSRTAAPTASLTASHSGTVSPWVPSATPTRSLSVTPLVGVGANTAGGGAATEGGRVDSSSLAIGLGVGLSALGLIVVAYTAYFCYFRPKARAAEAAAARGDNAGGSDDGAVVRGGGGGPRGALHAAGHGSEVQRRRQERGRLQPSRVAAQEGGYDDRELDHRELGPDHLAALEATAVLHVGGPTHLPSQRAAGGGGGGGRPRSVARGAGVSHAGAGGGGRPVSTRVGAAVAPDTLRGYLSPSSRNLLTSARASSRNLGGAHTGASGRNLTLNPVLGMRAPAAGVGGGAGIGGSGMAPARPAVLSTAARAAYGGTPVSRTPSTGPHGHGARGAH